MPANPSFDEISTMNRTTLFQFLFNKRREEPFFVFILKRKYFSFWKIYFYFYTMQSKAQIEKGWKVKLMMLLLLGWLHSTQSLFERSFQLILEQFQTSINAKEIFFQAGGGYISTMVYHLPKEKVIEYKKRNKKKNEVLFIHSRPFVFFVISSMLCFTFLWFHCSSWDLKFKD